MIMSCLVKFRIIPGGVLMRNTNICLLSLIIFIMLASCSSVHYRESESSDNAPPPEEHFLITQPSDTPSAFDDMLEALMWRDGQCLLHQTGFDTNALTRDYYTGEKIPVKDAIYVTGASITTPRGGNIVSFSSRESAEHFMKDHGGQIVSYDDLTSMTFEKK